MILTLLLWMLKRVEVEKNETGVVLGLEEKSYPKILITLLLNLGARERS